MERATTVQRINEIFNHPEIRRAFDVPALTGKEMDFSAFISNTNNIGLVDDEGCILFRRHQPGIYECHVAVLPEYRGQGTKDFCFRAFQFIFTETDAFEIMTKCLVDDVASNAGARIAFQKMFTTRPYTETNDGLKAMNSYSMTIQHWATIAPGLEDEGDKFHEHMQAEHEDDPVHNRYAGVAMLMVKGGQPWKALLFYNRAAVMSGYKPCRVISTEPLIVDIIDAKMQITGRTFEVIHDKPSD